MADFEVILEVRGMCPGMRDGYFKYLHQIPHHMQQVMSGEATPMLAGAILSFKMFMSAWKNLGEMHSRLEGWIDMGLAYARKYYG